MKKIILLILLYAVLVISVLAQGQGIGYQAILRNAEGDPIANETVTVLISLLPSSDPGITPLYTEFHIAETNDFGLVNLEVGRGVAQEQPFTDIDWSSGSMFIEVSIDEDDGNNFQVVGTRELLAVPYALYAANAEQSVQTLSRSGDLISLSNGGGSFTDQVNDADADATNEIQDLQLDGNLLSITGNENAASIDLSAYAGGGSTLTEEEIDAFVANNGYLTSETDDQALRLADNTLTLEDGGTVDLSAYLDNTDTQLTEAQVDAFANNNGYLSSEVDGDVTNEIQDLNLTGNTLKVTNNSSASDIDLSPYLDNTDTQLTEAQVDAFANNNGYLSSEVDGDVTNEIQDLNLTGNTLKVTNNSSASDIDLSPYLDNTDTQLTEAQVDAFANNNGYLSSEVDGDVTNEIQDLNLTGNTLKVTNNSSATDIDLSPYLDNTDTQLTEAQVDAFANNNGYLSSEIDGSITNEIQDLSLTGDNLKITNNTSASTIDLSTYKDNTDAQTLSLTGSQLSISGGNNVDLPNELPASLGTTGQVLTVNSAVDGVEWSTKVDPEFTKTGDVISGGNTTADFVFGSTALDNDNSTTNDDNRMFFDKSKGAFRAGNGTGTSWDETSRGDFSMAIGSSAIASGDYSSAIGSRISAIGNYATAIGIGPSARSFAEIAIGGFNTFYTPNSTSSWDNADRLLVLGNGTHPRGPSDALIVYKSGDATLYGELTIDADNAGGSQGYTFPGQDGTSGQVMTTDGSGNVTFQNVTVSEVDGSITNEIQDLNLTGDNLKVTNNTSATTIDLSPYKDNTDEQELSISGNNVSISGGNSINLPNELPTLGNSGQLLTVNSSGTAIEWASPAEAPVFTRSSNIVSAGSTGDALLFGASSLNNQSGTDDDFRLVFNVAKGAFRAGRVSGTQWDDTNVGHYSFSTGDSNTASGTFSSALGVNNTASGTHASALSGTENIAAGTASVATGIGNFARSLGEVAIGQWGTDYTPSSMNTFFDENDRAFVIGNGTSSNRSDAFTVFKNGSIGLFDFSTAPTATTNRLYSVNGALHYNGNEVGGGGASRTFVTEASSSHTIPSGHTYYHVNFPNASTRMNVTLPTTPSSGDEVVLTISGAANPANTTNPGFDIQGTFNYEGSTMDGYENIRTVKLVYAGNMWFGIAGTPVGSLPPAF